MQGVGELEKSCPECWEGGWAGEGECGVERLSEKFVYVENEARRRKRWRGGDRLWRSWIDEVGVEDEKGKMGSNLFREPSIQNL